MEFAEFAARAAAIEDEQSDLETVSLVAELFCDADDDLETVARFVQGRVFAAHDGTKLDIGPSLCYAALAKAAEPNVTADDIEARLASVGEVGSVAEEIDLGGQQGLSAFGAEREALTVAGIDARLRTLAAASGVGSTETKIDTLFGLFNRTSDLEARFLARLVLGEMRIGVGEGTVRDAVAEAFCVPTGLVERALQVSNDSGLVARLARDEAEAGLAEVHLEIGRPVRAMLAQAGTAVDALSAWDGEAAVETKYDGARVQVHYDGETTRLFSRNLEDVTDALPEVVETVESSLSAPAILDGEVVAIGENGKVRPFQEVLRRFRRKHDIELAREDVAVTFHGFDCLHAKGDDLLDVPLVDRHARLAELLPERTARLVVTNDPDEIADIESDALEAGHEGIMLKNPDSSYTPGARGKNWLKRKPDVETLDLVVTGAEWGEGRRANVLGTFLLSARVGHEHGARGDGYATLGKVATGISDEELHALSERLEPHIRAESGTVVEIEPTVVFEVGYEEIQRSPTYSSGYALRFPRFIGVREDKSPSDADSLERVERLAAEQ